RGSSFTKRSRSSGYLLFGRTGRNGRPGRKRNLTTGLAKLNRVCVNLFTRDRRQEEDHATEAAVVSSRKASAGNDLSPIRSGGKGGRSMRKQAARYAVCFGNRRPRPRGEEAEMNGPVQRITDRSRVPLSTGSAAQRGSGPSGSPYRSTGLPEPP